MACMKLGSKPEVFLLDGHTWLCSTELASDVIVEVGDISFHLHKFPLLSRSRVLENLIGEHSRDDEKMCILQLPDIPGGARTFLLVANFCYGVKIELNSLNVVSLRCAAEYLHMSGDCGDGNLISQTENFLVEIFGNWTDSLRALQTCEEVLPLVEELHIVTRCINSLAMKACAVPTFFSWPICGSSKAQSPEPTVFWNGIRTSVKPQPVGEDWWYDDVSSLRLSLYKRLILAVGSNGMRPEKIAGALMHFAMKHLPLLGRQSNIETSGSTVSVKCEAGQRHLLEKSVEILSDQKGVSPSKFRLRLLRTAMILHAGPSCRENLEKRIGTELDQAALQDLLIPNMGYSVETLYDIDCIQRMLDHFMLVDRGDPTSYYVIDAGHLMGGSHSLTSVTLVAHLIDGYLAEVAPDVNLIPAKFQSLAAIIPDYARPLDDGIYRAIDIYLKAHPWVIDSEREQLCRLMNCQKLSLEASTHAAQNERLPIRVIVQVLFYEQLRLRTSITCWFFVSDSLENQQNPSGNLALNRDDAHSAAPGATQNQIVAVDDMRELVSVLEKECLSMKEGIEKLVKAKNGWNILFRKFGFSKSKSRSDSSPKVSKPGKSRESQASFSAPLKNGTENQNDESEIEIPSPHHFVLLTPFLHYNSLTYQCFARFLLCFQGTTTLF